MRKSNRIYYFLIMFVIFSCSGNKNITSSSNVSRLSQMDSMSVNYNKGELENDGQGNYDEDSIVKSSNPAVEEDYVERRANRKIASVDPDPQSKYNPNKKGKKNNHQIIPGNGDNQDDEIKMGELVYHIPDTMIAKKTYIIKIRINRDTSDKSILGGIDPKIIESQIKTTSKMEVEIVDPAPDDRKSFEIVKSNEDVQIIDNDGYTEWIYGVTPLKSGQLKLNIVVSIIKGDNKKQVVYFDDVYVKSNPKANVSDFISNNWQWIMSSIIIPLIIWYYNNRKKKRKVSR